LQLQQTWQRRHLLLLLLLAQQSKGLRSKLRLRFSSSSKPMHRQHVAHQGLRTARLCLQPGRVTNPSSSSSSSCCSSSSSRSQVAALARVWAVISSSSSRVLVASLALALRSSGRVQLHPGRTYMLVLIVAVRVLSLAAAGLFLGQMSDQVRCALAQQQQQ
jgi:hypothetical protein